ncbi:uncharacterized protein [Spinacia oleracea]|uniref:Retrotransposon Copia-like N-terminal domain-containing protein n=1 Tax=Spinacia oleracea TaxID=3562 RepID=A0ABM3RSP1_SPIOL|nr:uncharacterized protein LOC110779282 [Spinacia oleracea]
MADVTKLHPATTVSNIKTCIPITLDYEGTQYINWSTLFLLHCRANLVVEHIVPSSPSTTNANADDSSTDKLQWQRLDDIVRQWIYGTISNDLLNTILNQDDSAQDAWNRLVRLFQGNKSARALYLDTQFTNTKLDQFSGVKPYCTRLKVLSDNLRNVGAPVSEDRMVLRLLQGLSADYKTFRTNIQHRVPLPPFDEVRTMLEFEEESLADDQTDTGSATALFHSNSTNAVNVDQDQPSSHNNRNHNNNSGYRGKKSHRGRGGNNHRHNNRHGGGNGGNGSNGGGRNSSSRSHDHQQQQQFNGAPSFWHLPPWAGNWQAQTWATPPCPYPSSGWQFRPTSPRPVQPQQAGVLGARPQQAYYMATPHPMGYVPTPTSYSPTDIDQAMHTMSMNPPDDNWYMDTGATSHMTSSQGFADGESPNEM